MPRAPRIEFAGAIYHAMNRGNHLEPIFQDDQDRTLFLKTLEETCISSGWVLHSFIFMSNHYHLLVETQRPTLVKGMQYLNSTYTQRFNSRHKTRGHLFQGRYKALLVDVESPGYFLTVSDYIHLNLVRMKRAHPATSLKELLQHSWCSAGWLAGNRKNRPQWLRWERVYGELGLKDWRSRSRREYREYLQKRIVECQNQKQQRWELVRRGWCLGSDKFVKRMKEKLEKLAETPRDEESWAGEAVEELEQDRADRFLKEGIKKLGYDRLEKLKGMDRYLLARWIRMQTKVSVKWLAKRLGLKTRGGMSHGIYLANQQIQKSRPIQNRYRQLSI